MNGMNTAPYQEFAREKLGCLLYTSYAYVRSKTSSKHIRRSLGSLIVGYVLFMAPTTFVNIIDPSTIIGIPSIMCGFAVLMAVVLAGKVLPEYVNEK